MHRLVVLLLALVLPAAAVAQTVAIAQISGVVTDESGGALPGVEVVVTQTSTGLTRFVITGRRRIRAAEPAVGPYKLEAKLQGFSTFEQTGITLQVGASPVDQRDAEGRRARGDDHGHAPTRRMVETRSTAVGTVVTRGADGRPAARRPAGARSWCCCRAPPSTNAGNGLIGSQRQYPSAVAISVAGGTGNSTIYLVDGALQQRPGDEHRPADAVPGRAPGVQGRDRRAAGALRHLHRRDGQRRDQGRHQPVPRQRVRVPARPSLQRHQRVRDQPTTA